MHVLLQCSHSQKVSVLTLWGNDLKMAQLKPEYNGYVVLFSSSCFILYFTFLPHILKWASCLQSVFWDLLPQVFPLLPLKSNTFSFPSTTNTGISSSSRRNEVDDESIRRGPYLSSQA